MYGFYQCPHCCPYWQMMQQQGTCVGQPYTQPWMNMPVMQQPLPTMPPFLHMQNEPTRATPSLCKGFYYTTVPGDTLYLISRRFNVSLDALVQANPGVTDPAKIYPGMNVCIPRNNPGVPVPEPPTCEGGYIYTVVKGDTLSAIARRFDLTTQDLVRANPQLTNPNQLYIDQKICIPLPIPEPPACDNTHIVKTGETLTTIATRYNLTVAQLLTANPQITNPNLIFTGQVICIPEEE